MDLTRSEGSDPLAKELNALTRDVAIYGGVWPCVSRAMQTHDVVVLYFAWGSD